MAGQIFTGLSQAIGACFSWFEQVINSLGFFGIIIGAFTIVTVSRFLLAPIVGGFMGSINAGASDMVSKRSGKRNGKSQKEGKSNG